MSDIFLRYDSYGKAVEKQVAAEASEYSDISLKQIKALPGLKEELEIYMSNRNMHGVLLYTGRVYFEDEGLYYYRLRWYDAEIRRFITKDPIGLAGGINEYGYVKGNPVKNTDPYGLAILYQSEIPAGSTYFGNMNEPIPFYGILPEDWRTAAAKSLAVGFMPFFVDKGVRAVSKKLYSDDTRKVISMDYTCDTKNISSDIAGAFGTVAGFASTYNAVDLIHKLPDSKIIDVTCNLYFSGITAAIDFFPSYFFGFEHFIKILVKANIPLTSTTQNGLAKKIMALSEQYKAGLTNLELNRFYWEDFYALNKNTEYINKPLRALYYCKRKTQNDYIMEDLKNTVIK